MTFIEYLKQKVQDEEEKCPPIKDNAIKKDEQKQNNGTHNQDSASLEEEKIAESNQTLNTMNKYENKIDNDN